jgi:8-oxo-dGTP pyrophosphatase MutT (NUDIX family)
MKRCKPAIFCANCGGFGHVYKNCNHPVTSYGIICYRIQYNPMTGITYPEYLMVQRKDSMSYVEFIRGKYQLENREYLMRLCRNMTNDEHIKIRTKTFEELWRGLWHNADNRMFVKEFEEAKQKFQALKTGFYLKNRTGNKTFFFDLQYLLSSVTAQYEETEWGFPKGRRNINEHDIQCALREFSEETGYNAKHMSLHCDIKPIEEVFSGTNKVRYKHVYYLAVFIDQNNVKQQFNKHMAHEISKVQWFSYKDAQSRIRNYNVERKELFHRVNILVSKNLFDINKVSTSNVKRNIQ